jgi:anti-sigma regulatory factor (Ser/Thr protein kinase)
MSATAAAVPIGMLHFEMTDASQIAAARRATADLATRIGLDETARGRIAIVVTEIGTNLVRHAEQGELLARALVGAGAPGLELLAIDRGPGIPDLVRAERDGFSTAGSAGTGLGAIRRLADRFDIRSTPGRGTLLVAGFGASEAPLEPAVVLRAKPEERVPGDAWAARPAGAGMRLLVADGLGHGPDAAAAARLAVRVFEEERGSMEDYVTRAHRALAATRGAAIGVLEVGGGRAGFVGVGNIACRVRGAQQERSLVSHNGTVGHAMRRVQRFDVACAPGDLVVMHSDGLATQWGFDRYAAVASGHPALLCGALYRDLWRRRDDVTVLAWRIPDDATLARARQVAATAR